MLLSEIWQDNGRVEGVEQAKRCSPALLDYAVWNNESVFLRILEAT